MEMTPSQARALQIYKSSATIENGYTPKTYKEIESDLRAEGLQGSSSSIHRWSEKFNFKGCLEASLSLSIIDDQDNTTKGLALRKLDERKAVDILRNNELTSDGYEVLENFTTGVLERLDEGKKVSLLEIKLVKDIVILTSGREDKLLDRLAGAGTETLTSEEILKQFEEVDLDLEEEI